LAVYNSKLSCQLLLTTVNYNKVHIVIENNVIPITDTVQIPLSEIGFRFSPSRGPGGQHVNRAHTRVTLLFDVSNSPSLDESTREKLFQELRSQLDSRGNLQITVQDSRSQNRNRQLAITRFARLLYDALQEQAQRIPSKPSKKAKKKRLEEKKKKSQRKKERRQDWSKDI
jgi:ribosome-associated protein